MAKETKRPGTAAEQVPPTTAVAPIDWSATEVTGMEHVGSEDLGIPFLVMLQKGSPQVDNTHSEYASKGIDGAKSGDIINNISNQVLYKAGGPPLVFIPCYYQRLFMEWSPRDKGGGLIRSHADPSIVTRCTRNDKNQDILPNGNIIVTTGYFFGKLITDEAPLDCVVGMASTQLKKARQWLNMATSIKMRRTDGSTYTPPLFSHKYHLSAEAESNNKGSWHGWKIELAGPVETKELATAAIELSKTIHAGKQRMALPPPPQSGSDNDGDNVF